MRILLLGYVGNNNIGDDLMMEETISELRKEFHQAEISVLIRYKGCKELPTWEGVEIIDYHPFRLGIIKVFVYEHFLISKYDFVLWVGGTCFGDVGKVAMYPYFMANQRKKIPYGYIGIGIDYCENKTRKMEISQLLMGSDITVFRDEKSLYKAREIVAEYNGHHALETMHNMFLAEDIVYQSIVEKIEKSKTQSNRLLISWRYQNQYMSYEIEKNSMEEIIAYVKKKCNEYEEIVFLPLDEYLDKQVNEDLYIACSSIPNVKMIYHMNPDDKIRYIVESRTYLCGRLHGMMIALVGKCNLVAFDYSLKTKIFLENLGCKNQIVRTDGVTMQKIEEAVNWAEKYSMSNDQMVNKVALAHRNYELLFEYIHALIKEP